ncbi:MAG: zinc ribbon domain-containing protein [Treponema sp.]|nr:zinc ribbon domain-containing protein [Treponema sp.]
MAFCRNCGSTLPPGTRFCQNCGSPQDVIVPPPVPNSNKRQEIFSGVVLKCPSCGERISSGDLICPSCGYTIEKKEASKSVVVFLEGYTSLRGTDKRKEFIEMYPIPNNKEDIRDFLIFAVNQSGRKYDDVDDTVFWGNIWAGKCRQVLEQARTLFGNDGVFNSQLLEYESKVSGNEENFKSFKKEKSRKKLRTFLIVFSSIMGTLILIIVVFSLLVRSCVNELGSLF